MNKSGIYQILNKLTGKSYIGSAVNIKNRWSVHLNLLKINNNPCRFLQHAWNKYGEEAFQFNVLEYVSNPEWLIEIEQYWIDFLETANGEYGYNICPVAGSHLGVKRSEETKNKISKKHKGKIATEATRYKMSKATSKDKKGKKRKPFTEEHKKNMSKAFSKAKTGKRRKPFTEDHKNKISESHKGLTHSEETKEKMRIKYWSKYE